MGQQAREPLGERGRSADVPNDIPKRGWQDIAWRVVRAARRDRVTMFAAGVAFYALLALFPTIAAVISVWMRWSVCRLVIPARCTSPASVIWVFLRMSSCRLVSS